MKRPFFSFGILPFVAGGFTDSLNPCGLTVLIFFVTFLLFLNKERRAVVKGGCLFILGLFLSKFLMIGPLEGIRDLAAFWTVGRFLYLWIALLALVGAGFQMRDWWVCKKSKSESGSSLKIAFPKTILGNPLFSFGGGILLGIVGSICPEPFYLTTFLYALAMEGRLLAVISGWLMYALGFILPLVGVLLLWAGGIRSQRLRTVLEERRAMVKIVCSAVLFAVGLGLIYTFY